MAINYGRKHFDRVLIFRPHNVYGPDMGFEHVMPQFALRLKEAGAAQRRRHGAVPIQGDGRQTRSFCHVDDLVAGVMVMREQRRASRHLSRRHHGGGHDRRRGAADRAPLPAARSSSCHRRRPPAARTRRCPDIAQARAARLCAAGAARRGLPPTVEWYWAQRTACAVKAPIRRINDRFRGDQRVFPTKVARAAGTGGSVPVECCQVCGQRQARDRAVARLHAAGQPDGADRRGAAATALVSDQPAVLPATASWCSSASRSIRSSSSRRNIPTPAA